MTDLLARRNGRRSSKKTARLPPCPQLTNEALSNPTAAHRFRDVDALTKELIARRKLPVRKAEGVDPVFWLRRSVLCAAIHAWKVAADQLNNAKDLRRSARGAVKRLDRVTDYFDVLKLISEQIKAREQRIDKSVFHDPTLRSHYVRHARVSENIDQILDLHHSLGDNFAQLRVDLAEEGKIPRDPLANQFVTNLIEIWKAIDGRRPGTSREGPFVRFANAAWIAAGWEAYSGHRGSLGKLIAKRGKRENWALFRPLDC